MKNSKVQAYSLKCGKPPENQPFCWRFSFGIHFAVIIGIPLAVHCGRARSKDMQEFFEAPFTDVRIAYGSDWK
jgi:hypothetical protein